MVSSSKVRKLQEEITRLRAIVKEQDELWLGPDRERRTDGTHTAHYWHAKEVIHHTLTDPDTLRKKTLVPMEAFEFLVSLCKGDILSRDDVPLFRDDDERAEDPGNRCKLLIEETVLLYLEYQRTRHSMDELEADFGIDQTTVSNYIRFIADVLGKVLPTPNNLLEMIKTVRSVKELEEFILDLKAKVDGSHVGTNEPSDKKERDARHGVKKRPTGNTAFMTTGEGEDAVCIAQGETKPGREHDLNGAEKIIEEVGRIAARVGAQVAIEGDKAYTGAEKRLSLKAHRGIKMVVPLKNPPNGKLGKRDRARNRRNARERIDVEHYIRRIKTHKRGSETFTGTLDDLGRVLQIICGTVNLIALGPEEWTRLRKKYGPRVRRRRT